MKATNPDLTSVGSHSVHDLRGGNPSKEECYPVATVTWRGTEHSVRFEASRYTSSDGHWSPWRFFAASYGNDLTDTARRAVTEAVEPVFTAWLASDAYKASRQNAFKHMLKNLVREERYNTDRLTEMVNRFEHELTPDDWHHLRVAISALDTYLRRYEAI